MLQPWEKDNLMALSKEQLLYLIGLYKHTNFMIGEVLVDESKMHLTPENAIEKIREYECENQFSLRDKHLGAWIDMQMGKITKKEYRKLRLGEYDE